MASRSAAEWQSETLQGTRRGREDSGDVAIDFFPQKYEHTEILEDPEQLNKEWRQTIQDFSPDTASYAYELPRRNVMSRSHLNHLDSGVFGSSVDPYFSEMADTSFHDHDPRGYSDQQPWSEYRRGIEAQMRRFDYRDDGDYSTTGGGVSPYTLYQNIRAAQNWTKARFKIFDTSYENMHSGGVGVYPNISQVFKSARENTGVQSDEDGMAMTLKIQRIDKS